MCNEHSIEHKTALFVDTQLIMYFNVLCKLSAVYMLPARMNCRKQTKPQWHCFSHCFNDPLQAVFISSFKKTGIRQSIKTLLNSMFCWLYINAPILQPVWKGNWLKSSASSHCTSTPVINDHHRPEQSEQVFKTNGCGGQSQSKDFCLWNQINCSATNPPPNHHHHHNRNFNFLW